jgi:hypothetical protein
VVVVVVVVHKRVGTRVAVAVEAATEVGEVVASEEADP